MTLAWSANTETDLDGYRIYHRQEGQAYDYNYPIWEGTDRTCTIYSLDDTTKHFFVARAFDIYSNESEDSCEVSLEASVNIIPTADAGPDQTVDEGSTVTLDGSNSWDAEGTVVSYDWTQIEGVAVTLSEAWTSQPFFTAPYVDLEVTSLTFQLTVTDEWGLQSQDTCIVTVTPLNKEPLGQVAYVSSIAIKLRQMGRNYKARAYVVVEDEYGIEVEEASIRGDWSLNGTFLNASFGATNSGGEAKLNSDKVKPESGDTFTLKVTEVIKDDYTFDPSGNTYSLAVP
ncbi:MAG: PKD domain-containing protein [Planctomycetota bacterium]